MIAYAIKNGVPFDVAHSFDQQELLAYAIIFAQLENGNKEWNWDNMAFVER
jgi:hypothetical protein